MSKSRYKRKKNKKMVFGMLLLLISIIMIIASSLAIFSDAGAAVFNATVGTLDLVVKDKTRTQYFEIEGTEENVSYENDIDNINPGDIIDTGFTVINEGSKSTVLKTSVLIKVKGREVIDESMFHLFSYYGDSAETQRETIRGGVLDKALELTFEGEDAETGELIYKYEMENTDFKILNGKNNLPGAEIETDGIDEFIARYLIYFNSEAKNEYQGVHMNATITVEGMQYRNNNEGEWEVVADEDTTIIDDEIYYEYAKIKSEFNNYISSTGESFVIADGDDLDNYINITPEYLSKVAILKNELILLDSSDSEIAMPIRIYIVSTRGIYLL